MQYNHTQSGYFHYLFYGVFIAVVFLALSFPIDASMITLLVFGTLLGALSQTFITLTIRDDGEALVARYGPIPLFGTRIPYNRITSIGPARTTLIDGWGIHYIPWRGTTYNIWGYDCVKLTLGKKVVRLGTDDLENLVAFLQRRVEQENYRTS